jgi:hypothetical protein
MTRAPSLPGALRGTMHYSITTPPASGAAERPIQIDDALIADARRALLLAVEGLPSTATLSQGASEAFFAAPMAALCDATRPRGVPVEKLIIALKLAWPNLAELRIRFGDGAPEALSGAVSACIAAYFQADDRRCAD